MATIAPVRLVIVDDDAPLAHVVGLLAREAYPTEDQLVIDTCRTAEAASATIQALRGDGAGGVVFLSDYHLPPSSATGLDLLEHVARALPGARRALMTGRPPAELEPTLSRARLDAFLAKPFTADEFHPLLRRLVEDARQAARATRIPTEGAAAPLPRQAE
ncbi:MAG TPA: response regulator [Candidatus Thermoplasmatota archaeon]|nr:response regulator [Candidatus Thermoplasmatota archaeon]